MLVLVLADEPPCHLKKVNTNLHQLRVEVTLKSAKSQPAPEAPTYTQRINNMVRQKTLVRKLESEDSSPVLKGPRVTISIFLTQVLHHIIISYLALP